jgi:alanyl-tRNA synthetase
MKLFASQLNSYQQLSEDLVLDCFPLQNSISHSPSSTEHAATDTYGVILEDSCLYPEGGGQPWDLGTIDDHEVLSVEMTPKGLQVTVKHPFSVGSRVVCKVDWDRRYDFMQQHSCQHLLRSLVLFHQPLPPLSFPHSFPSPVQPSIRSSGLKL